MISTDKLGKASEVKQPVDRHEVPAYQDFKDRSVVGHNLEGSEVEVGKHSNLKANGNATTRLSTDASNTIP